MPRRRRMAKQRRDGLTPGQRSWFLNEWAAHDDLKRIFRGGEARARRVWEERKDDWIAAFQLTHPGRMPVAFWRFEPDVPDTLREEALGVLVESYVPGTTAIDEWSSHAPEIWGRGELARRRTAWLQGAGQHHVRPYD